MKIRLLGIMWKEDWRGNTKNKEASSEIIGLLCDAWRKEVMKERMTKRKGNEMHRHKRVGGVISKSGTRRLVKTVGEG